MKIKVQGFTLLEYLVALMLSMIIVSLLVEAALMMNQLVARQTKQLEEQQALIVAEHFFRDAINSAGYLGCRNTKDRAWPLSLSYTENELSIKRMSEKTAEVVEQTDKQLLVKGSINFKVNRDYVIQNCQHAELVKFNKIGVQGNLKKLTLNKALQHNYQSPSTIGAYETLRFFVKDDVALYREDSLGVKNEVVAGIVAIKLERHMPGIIKLDISTNTKHKVIYEKERNA